VTQALRQFLQQQGLDALGLAMLAALGLHALVILGVSFDIHREQPPPPERTLDITVVKPKKAPPPEEATKLAQHTQQGGAEQLGDSHAAAPASRPTSRPKPAATQETRRATTPRPEPRPSKPLVTARSAERRIEQRTEKPIQQARPTPDVAQLLASTQHEIDRLTAVIAPHSVNASRHERRKAINASTQEYKYSSYLDAWRRKVENIGNLNYPDEAKRQRLFGHLLLHVVVRADGSVAEINVRRSSGHKILDDAAVRIVRLAAPFAPFPAEIREEVDLLDITRTWVFQRNNQLSSNR
jgi:protein TonB